MTLFLFLTFNFYIRKVSMPGDTHLSMADTTTLDDVVIAYQECGGGEERDYHSRVISVCRRRPLFISPAFATGRSAKSPFNVYSRPLATSSESDVKCMRK